VMNSWGMTLLELIVIGATVGLYAALTSPSVRVDGFTPPV